MEQKQVVVEVLTLALGELEKCNDEAVVLQAKQAVSNLIDRLSGKIKERKLPPILGQDKKKANLNLNTTPEQSQVAEDVAESDLSAAQIMFEANKTKYKEAYSELTPKQLKAALKKEGLAIEKVADDLQIDISKYTGEARFEVVIQRLLNI